MADQETSKDLVSAIRQRLEHDGCNDSANYDDLVACLAEIERLQQDLPCEQAIARAATVEHFLVYDHKRLAEVAHAQAAQLIEYKLCSDAGIEHRNRVAAEWQLKESRQEAARLTACIEPATGPGTPIHRLEQLTKAMAEWFGIALDPYSIKAPETQLLEALHAAGKLCGHEGEPASICGRHLECRHCGTVITTRKEITT